MSRLLSAIAVMVVSMGASAQLRIYGNYTPGLSAVAPAPLWVEQGGNSNLFLWAHYKCESLTMPIFYSYRLGVVDGGKGWELEMDHLKIYLTNTTNEIQHFSVSHGYNQLTLNRVRYLSAYGVKWGTGLVLAHPENRIRGLTLEQKGGLFDRGYFVAGPVVQYGIFKELTLGRVFYVMAEAKISAAYANVPVVNGRAHVPLVSFQLQLGPGFNLYNR